MQLVVAHLGQCIGTVVSIPTGGKRRVTLGQAEVREYRVQAQRLTGRRLHCSEHVGTEGQQFTGNTHYHWEKKGFLDQDGCV